MENNFKDWDNTRKYIKAPYQANTARIGHLEYLSDKIDETYSEKVEEAYGHSQVVGNPHGTTKEDIGLSNVDNTSDLDKPVSVAQNNAMSLILSQSNSYTDQSITNLSKKFNTIFNLSEGNNEFAIVATIIGRATGTFANGNPITWEILDNTTNHGSSFFRTVSANATTKRLEIGYPTVKSVLDFDIKPDEILAGYGTTMGASGGLNKLDVTTTLNHSGYAFLIGAGTTTWTKQGGTSPQVTAGTFSTTDGYTLLTFGSNFSHFENQSIAVVYQGSNNYRIERTFVGVAANQIKFRMIDILTNLPVLTAPTASDMIQMVGIGKYRYNVNMSEFSTIVLGKNDFLLGNNFLCSGSFELWMKVLVSSATSMLAKWQSKLGVTSYRLYRDTLENLSTKALVYSGTSLEFEDVGLTSNTMYYYQLCDQSDVEITQYKSRTEL